MEELQVIETTTGRQFKPWVDADKLQQIVRDPASVTAIASEIASGKQAIAQAINAKGGSASATETFSELAEAVEGIPNYSDMVKLAGIIAGGNYEKNALQGHDENVKYGKTEIVDRVGAFETFSTSYTFQYWDLIKKIELPYWRTQKTDQNLRTFTYCGDGQTTSVTIGLEVFPTNKQLFYCSKIRKLYMPNLRVFKIGYYDFYQCSLIELELGTITQISTSLSIDGNDMRNITIGLDTDIDLPFQFWTAAGVIAEGQSGIDELNSNLQTNLISKLYQGGGKILRLGTTLYDVTTQETRDMVTAKGWTLQRG